jgi:hexokinase
MSSPAERAQQFIQDHGLNLGAKDAETFYNSFSQEMQKGLEGKGGSLAMLPTYIGVDKLIPPGKTALVIDAGGTNLRVCKVKFDDKGEPNIGEFQLFTMPGTSGELSANEFFQCFADYISPILEDRSIQSIGFCFSYPTEILPNRDGILLNWTKEVQAPEVVGQQIGRGILERIKTRDDLELVILNDTVAALLAAKAQGERHLSDNYAGFILGTGTNMAIVTDNKSISKIDDAPEGQQAINMESGNFHPPFTSDIDDRYCQSTNLPDHHRLEKMISGAYLGDLYLTGLKTAQEEGLFSPEGQDIISKISSFSTRELGELSANPHLEGPLKELPSDDLQIAYLLGKQFIKRASWLSSFMIAGSLRNLKQGQNPLHPICITIDGSTAHKLHGFYNQLETNLTDLLNREGIYFITSHRDQAPVIGAAIAALTNSSKS